MDRRTFMHGLAATTCALPFSGAFPSISQAETEVAKLSVVTRAIEVNGKAATVYGLGTGKDIVTLNAGESNLVDLSNNLTEPTMVHWHGITPHWPFDGVPDMPAPLLQPGETRRYELPGGLSGTHWMHAHTLQEQNLLAAPLIVRPAAGATKDEQEVVILLHDFSFTPASELLDKLKSSKGMGMAGMNHMSGGQGGMMHMMMGGMDVNDIEYDAFLANARTLRDPQVTQVEKGGKVRLRIINGATATGFVIDTGTLDGLVLAVDGQEIVPLKTRRFPLSMGQRVDIALGIPSDGGAFPILALREGGKERTGLVLATSGAKVSKLADAGQVVAPNLTLEVEQRLTAAMPLEAKKVQHRFLVGLMGSMQGYSWNLTSDKPLEVRDGARVEIEMRNMSMMTHPMHLHGHHFQVVAVNGTPFTGALRDTVLIPPMQTVTIAFDARNPGKAWAFHCHHLYHMASGMMTTLGYEGA